MNASTLTRRTKLRARELGFTSVGIAPVGRSHNAAALERWLTAGNHGEMGYMARMPERRSDPREVLPGARSAVCVTLDYTPRPDGGDGGLVPHISTYARNDDYHDVMGPKLRLLLEFLRDEAGASVGGRAYVDTGPVLERELAAAAGLGWVGKNTQLLHRTGSWFFLGEILVDVELVPDGPVTDHCGSCTACIDACPTDALLDGYVLDSRRCISYLNIELRGAIPLEHRADLDQHLYGCDICQDVCPWNRKAESADRPEFAPRQEFRSLTLAGLLGIEQEEFSRTFRGSPMKRTKRRGLARNAAVLLGNSGDRDAVPALAQALASDPEPLVRGHAAWALGRIGGQASRRELDRAAGREADDPVVREIRRAQDRSTE